MIRITVACAAGMSSSLLLKKMQKFVDESGLNVSILSVAEDQFYKKVHETDILLLSPQVSFSENKNQELYGPLGIKVMTIGIVDFGRMDGEQVIKKALKLLENKEKKGEYM